MDLHVSFFYSRDREIDGLVDVHYPRPAANDGKYSLKNGDHGFSLPSAPARSFLRI